MRFSAALSIYSPANRKKLLILVGLMVVVIAIIDWWIKSYISLGFLYLFPILIAGGFLSRTQIVSLAVLCAVLQEEFSNLPTGDTWPRLILSSAGFVGTGLFIFELLLNRRMMLGHLNEVKTQQQARREAEEQLQVLVDSSPAAIVTLDADGTVLLANEAAQEMLASGGAPLQGQNIATYLPALHAAVHSKTWKNFRTTLQCKGNRSDGDVFLAGIWFSTYASVSGNRLAAIFVDLSDDLRSREDLNLDYLLTNTRILMSAVSHEISNLCGAALVVHKNLSKVSELRGNADFEALGTLIHGLEQISAMELRGSSQQTRTAIELTSILDELRVLIDTAGHEHNISMQWEETGAIPLVWADRYGLMQVFLNLAKNSIRAMESAETKCLAISATVQPEFVTVSFKDTGSGIADPLSLFRPFQSESQGAGLGLYVSRALVRSFGGDLVYVHGDHGCCFNVVFERVSSGPSRGGANA
jgi:two-component system, LuxR family, sensor kinase FixL